MIFQLEQDWEGEKTEDQVIIPKERIQHLELEPSLSPAVGQIKYYIAGRL